MGLDVEDPTKFFGFGISSWIELLHFLMLVFGLLSILAMYLAHVYHNSGLISGGNNDFVAQYSL